MTEIDYECDMRPLRLEGRYMMPERVEFACHTLAVSPWAFHLSAAACPYRGQRIVAYLQDVGRVEGVVSEVARGEFWLRIEASERKRDQLTGVLASRIGGDMPPSWNHRASPAPEPSTSRRQLSPAYVAAVAEALDLTAPPTQQDAQQEQKPKPAAYSGPPIDATRRYLDFI
jgi:hypothetical protein